MFFESQPTVKLDSQIACRWTWTNDVVEKLNAEILLWLFIEAVNEKQVRFGSVEFDAPSATSSFKTVDGILKTTDGCAESEGI